MVPGPNYAWSMDAHCKLEHWGIQIYAAIDVYSRHIVWIYIGITGRTQVSVLAQYLAAAASTSNIPLIIRSDRGAETRLASAAHLSLSQQLRTRPNGEPLLFGDCFRYGTSKKNQRIEAWWNQGTRATLGRWRDFFEELSKDGDYDKDLQAHRIAFLAVYIPIIRTETLEFVDTWNHHRIRKQGDDVLAGRPYVLYHYPQESGGQQCGVPVDLTQLQPMIDDVVGFGTYQLVVASQWRQCGGVDIIAYRLQTLMNTSLLILSGGAKRNCFCSAFPRWTVANTTKPVSDFTGEPIRPSVMQFSGISRQPLTRSQSSRSPIGPLSQSGGTTTMRCYVRNSNGYSKPTRLQATQCKGLTARRLRAKSY